MPGFGVRDHAVIGLWHFSQRNRKRNKISFTLDLIMTDDTPVLKNGEVHCVAQQCGGDLYLTAMRRDKISSMPEHRLRHGGDLRTSSSEVEIEDSTAISTTHT